MTKSLNPKILHDQIFYYENVVNNTDDIIKIIEKSDNLLSAESLISDWHDWIASDESYIFGKRKLTNIENYNESLPEVRFVYDSLSSALDECAKDYSSANQVIIGERMPISISKYFSGSQMGPHTDSPPSPTSETISAVLYLNDNYSGGEISFPGQGIKIKPMAGSVVIFPSVPPFYHESLMVSEGIKYMSPAFWHLSK